MGILHTSAHCLTIASTDCHLYITIMTAVKSALSTDMIVAYWVSSTEDTVLVQSGTKALVCTATSITVLPCEEEAKASHNGVVPLIRELITIVVKQATIRNVEHSQHYWDMSHQHGVDAIS